MFILAFWTLFKVIFFSNGILLPETIYPMKKSVSLLSIHKRVLRIFIVVFILGFQSGCFRYFYKIDEQSSLSALQFDQLKSANKNFIIYDGSKLWSLNNPKIENGNLTGDIAPLSFKKQIELNSRNDLGSKRYYKNQISNTSDILNEVHLYVDSPLSLISHNEISLDKIKKIEIYDKDKAATTASWIIGTVGIAATAVILVAASTSTNSKPAPPPSTSGSSCPFVFTYDGSQYSFAGEIYSGAVYPAMERHDYLSLPNLLPVENTYYLYLKNQQSEIQFTNMTELFVIDHPENSNLYIDKYGNPFSTSEIARPIAAIDSEGKSQLEVLSQSDDRAYLSLPAKNNENLKDELILTFRVPEGCKTGKLVLRARNSILVDYSYEKYIAMFGDKLAKRQDVINKKPVEELQKWTLDQNIPLSVYLKEDSSWKFVDYFNLPGPMAFRDDIMKIDLSGKSQEIEIKLETGKLFWEIDQVGMDFSTDYTVSYAIVKPYQATDQDSADVLGQILFDDENYLVQPNIGDETELLFHVPNQPEGLKRSVYLHSKGHYSILGSDEPGKSLVYMYRFTKPQSFTRFVQEKYFEISDACR